MSFFGGSGKGKSGGSAATPSASPAAATAPAGRNAPASIESTIGPNTYVKGDIQGDGGLRIEGIFEGTIELTGNLVISESAKVRAEIKANNIQIAGAVIGNLNANRLEILETGRMWGNLNVKALAVNEGGYYQGQTSMPRDIQPPQLEPPKLALPAAESKPRVIDVEPESPKGKH